VLLYGSESWTIKAKDKARLITAEIKFMRRTAGDIWSDFKQNAEILEVLKVTPFKIKFQTIKQTGEIM
jgi:hypothetical protein